MTDDAEISPLVEKGGTTFQVVILWNGTGAPPHCLDKRFHILAWRQKKKHTSDLQHLGNMFIVFVVIKKKNLHN